MSTWLGIPEVFDRLAICKEGYEEADAVCNADSHENTCCYEESTRRENHGIEVYDGDFTGDCCEQPCDAIGQ